MIKTGDVENFARDNLQGQIDCRDGVESFDKGDAYNRGYTTEEQVTLAIEWFKKQKKSTLAPMI